MDHALQTSQNHSHVLYYDGVKKRLWIGGQRCHHGATGAILAGTAAASLALSKIRPSSRIGLLAAGSLLMLHDRHDLPIWFERGWGTQP